MPVRDTILVVDDTNENLRVLGALLEPHYRVRLASSGERALQVAVTEPYPDLVLLDVMMPDVDGYAVLRELRRNPQTRHTPVIFVSALGSTDDEELGLRLGAVDYISKPIKPAVVLARVRTQLELRRMRVRLQEQNGWLEREVARRVHDFQVVQDVSIRALAGLADARDTETGNHIRRTQSYVDILARRLATHPRFAAALQADLRALVVKAAPLHDLGKVGIPDHILNKPGRLTPEEFALMKGHARIGADALDRALRSEAVGTEPDGDVPTPTSVEAFPLAFLAVARDIARSHHERWDGTGYPDGLAGDDIPVSARLMALADVFDALSTARVYKPAFPFPTAVSMVLESEGQFDPDVLEAFRDSLAEFGEVYTRLADGRPS